MGAHKDKAFVFVLLIALSLVTNITFNQHYVENSSVNLMFNIDSSVEHDYYSLFF